MLDQARLKELFDYSPETGDFIRRVTTGGQIAGSVAGHLRRDGYLTVCVDGKYYLNHRLAWLWMTGEWPTPFCDHQDGDRANNKWANLRQADHRQNSWNRAARRDLKFGLKGVSRNRNGYSAHIYTSNGRTFLGYFRTPELAHEAYKQAAQTHFGAYAEADRRTTYWHSPVEKRAAP